jgi:tryptophan synthase beta chain
MSYYADDEGYFGDFGGAYVPEMLHATIEELVGQYRSIVETDAFKTEYRNLLRDFVGRPSPLYFAPRLSELYRCKIFLKREDLNHTGSHKINNVLGQAHNCGNWSGSAWGGDGHSVC